MGGKKKYRGNTKAHIKPIPSNTTSFAASSSSRSEPSRQASSLSVNDLISKSRHDSITTNAASGQDAHEARRRLTAIAAAKSVHPSVKEFLDIADVPSPKPRFDARTRLQRLCSPVQRAEVTMDSREASPEVSVTKDEVSNFVLRRTLPPFAGYLPDGPRAARGSLLHFSLQTLARNWLTETEYYRPDIASLPVPIKTMLLSYISRENRCGGLHIEDLEALFPEPRYDPEGASTGAGTHLELSGSIGNSINIQRIRPFLPNPVIDKTERKEDNEGEEEVWEERLLRLDHRPFENLTHLSLANPGPNISWPDLLKLRGSLFPLTHLSLAYWPFPTMASGKYSSPREANILIRQDVWSHSGQRLHQQHSMLVVLGGLAEATPLLEWLDVTGCFDWIFETAKLFWQRRHWYHLRTIVAKLGHGKLLDDIFARHRDVKNRYDIEGEQTWGKMFLQYMVFLYHSFRVFEMQGLSLDLRHRLSAHIEWEYGSKAELGAAAIRWAERAGFAGPEGSGRMAIVCKIVFAVDTTLGCQFDEQKGLEPWEGRKERAKTIWKFVQREGQKAAKGEALSATLKSEEMRARLGEWLGTWESVGRYWNVMDKLPRDNGELQVLYELIDALRSS